jgi:hypothetical protein
MVERDPEKFLAALIDAFRNRQEADTSLKPQYMFFCASMSAVPVRLTALDSLAEQFPRNSEREKAVAEDLANAKEMSAQAEADWKKEEDLAKKIKIARDNLNSLLGLPPEEEPDPLLGPK